MPEYSEYDQYCQDCGDRRRYANDAGDTFGRYCDGCGESWNCEDCNAGPFICQDCDYDPDCDHDNDDDYEPDCDCSDCRYARSGDGRVRNYSYRPVFIPKGGTDPLKMGIELEIGGSQTEIVDIVDAIAHDIRRGNVNGISSTDDSKHLYCKDDGSIQGVEIVSHPMTLGYARQFPFRRLLDELRDDCYVEDGYGLHVHVSRAAFQSASGKHSPIQTMKWLLFIQRNKDMLTGYDRLARRPESSWAKFGNPKRGEIARKAKNDPTSRRQRCNCDEYRMQHYMSDHCDDRYQAVNCNNPDTYELRFFKSTLSPHELYAAMEFVDASVRYCRTVPTFDVLAGRGLSWQRFASWAQRHNYKALVAEISK
jgi:hypothetical protein